MCLNVFRVWGFGFDALAIRLEAQGWEFALPMLKWEWGRNIGNPVGVYMVGCQHCVSFAVTIMLRPLIRHPKKGPYRIRFKNEIENATGIRSPTSPQPPVICQPQLSQVLIIQAVLPSS